MHWRRKNWPNVIICPHIYMPWHVDLLAHSKKMTLKGKEIQPLVWIPLEWCFYESESSWLWFFAHSLPPSVSHTFYLPKSFSQSAWYSTIFIKSLLFTFSNVPRFCALLSVVNWLLTLERLHGRGGLTQFKITDSQSHMIPMTTGSVYDAKSKQINKH